jgi:DNA-binding beta-propeller fold protein YncE
VRPARPPARGLRGHLQAASRAAGAASVAALSTALAACGAPAGPVALSAPPVAALAPPLTVTPAGRVVTLHANRPEGVAVADSSGEVVVDTQDHTLLVLTAPGALVRTIALPGSGRHVRFDGGLALVPCEGVARLAIVDAATGAVRSVAVGSAPHDVTPIPGDRALVGNEADGTVSVVNLDSGRAVQTLPAGLQPGGLVADGDWAGAVDVRGRYLYRYSVQAGHPVTAAGRLAVGAGPTHVVDLGGGLVAVADALGDAIDLVSLPRLAVVGHLRLSASPEGLAADPSRRALWVTTPGDNTLLEISLTGEHAALAARYPTVRQPNSVAVDGAAGTVYVTGSTSAGSLQILMPPR